MSLPTGDAGVGLERTVGRVLKVGVTASSLCLAAGLAASFLGVKADIAGPLLRAGLLVLLATPASRVIASVLAYLRSRDWLFVTLTLVVLLELVLSVIAARHAATL